MTILHHHHLPSHRICVTWTGHSHVLLWPWAQDASKGPVSRAELSLKNERMLYGTFQESQLFEFPQHCRAQMCDTAATGKHSNTHWRIKGSIFSVLVKCTINIANANASSFDFYAGQQAQMSCNPGYELSGPLPTCACNQTVVGTVPTCNPSTTTTTSTTTLPTTTTTAANGISGYAMTCFRSTGVRIWVIT